MLMNESQQLVYCTINKNEMISLIIMYPKKLSVQTTIAKPTCSHA